MDRKTFKNIKHYKHLVNKLNRKLEEELNFKNADDLTEELDEFSERLLFKDAISELDRDGSLKSEYLNLPKYTIVTAIAEYKNGFYLCELTSGELELIPKEMIRFS